MWTFNVIAHDISRGGPHSASAYTAKSQLNEEKSDPVNTQSAQSAVNNNLLLTGHYKTIIASLFLLSKVCLPCASYYALTLYCQIILVSLTVFVQLFKHIHNTVYKLTYHVLSIILLCM